MISRTIRDPAKLNDENRFDLSYLSAAEKLFVWRHRRRSISGRLLGQNGSRMSQAEAAELLGLERRTYSELENGLRARLSADEVTSLLKALGPLSPTTGELCLLARRRSGRSLSHVEGELKVSRPHFHTLERAGNSLVVALWESHGYRFPE